MQIIINLVQKVISEEAIEVTTETMIEVTVAILEKRDLEAEVVIQFMFSIIF